MKHFLGRKKSGEVVKSALRPSSVPGTPTTTKLVQFNDIEEVQHFFKVDRPIALSVGSSPVETYSFALDDWSKSRAEWEVRLANFPEASPKRQYLLVRIEQLSLSKDSESLIGTVAVANIAFEKYVTARFTFDYWETTSEIAAEYSNIQLPQQPFTRYDRFQFSIKLLDQANLENKTLFLCARYRVKGQEYWDNNSRNNFQVNFTRKLANTWAYRTRGEHYPSSPFSNRYNFDASLHAASTIRQNTRTGSAPAIKPIQNGLRQELNSAAYKVLI